jgi:hypothetical protein
VTGVVTAAGEVAVAAACSGGDADRYRSLRSDTRKKNAAQKMDTNTYS